MQDQDSQHNRQDCSGGILDSIPQDSSSTSSSAAGRHMETEPPPKKNPNVFWVILKGIFLALIIFIFFLLLGIATAAILNFVVAGGPPHSRRRRRSPSSSSSSSSSTSSSYDFDSDSAAYTAEELHRLLPCFEYSDGNTTTNDCAICLDNFHGGERIRRLPNCNHTFHSDCVEKWLTRVSNCPICRLRLNFMTADDERNKS